MSELDAEEVSLPDDDVEAQKAFEAGCLRFAFVYLVAYFTIAIISTVASVQTGTHWWVLGWGWPAFIMLAMMVGVSLGAWSDHERTR